MAIEQGRRMVPHLVGTEGVRDKHWKSATELWALNSELKLLCIPL